MAILVISARAYANLLERVLPVHSSLKARREVQKLKARKRSARQIQVNLNQEDAMNITGLWFSACYAPNERASAVQELESMVGAANDDLTLREPPVIMYSHSEWKSIIEIGTGQPSSIDLQRVDQSVPVFVQMELLWPSIEDYVQDMISKARSPGRIAFEAKHAVQEALVENTALAFGAMEETSEETVIETNEN